jgi:MFS family permease
LLFKDTPLTQPQIEKDLQHNIIINILEGAFFGLGLGFASFVTIIPLFVSNLTDSAILIGLVPAMHSAGWYLPQLFTAKKLSKQSRFKTTVMWSTIHERIPFLGLATVAWMSPQFDETIILFLVFGLLIWQGLGAGFTANPWQNMISKLIPDRIHGVFFGAQFGAVSVLMVIGSLLTGLILKSYPMPDNFALVFLFASIAMLVSMTALALVKETHQAPGTAIQAQASFRQQLVSILKDDILFRKFLLVRSLTQLGIMAIGFYSVYAVHEHGAPGPAIGLMTAIMAVTQAGANVVFGRIGDRKSHRFVLQLGAITLSLSALVAWLAPNYQWFYLAFALAGVTYVTVWTTQTVVTLQFGDKNQRPAYIGLSNTITAPSALMAPVLGGLLAEKAGYQITFVIAIFAAILTFGVLQSMAGWRTAQACTDPS